MASDDPGLGRRAFLATGAAALAGGAFVAGRSSAPADTRAPLPDTAPAGDDVSSWSAVRGQFAARPDDVDLDGFVLALPPAAVRRAVDAHRRAFDRDGLAYLHREEARAERAVLEAAAGYLESEPDLIALTDSTSMGLGLIYGGALLARGDELLTTSHDFYATHEAMRFAALRSGATVRKVSLYGDPAVASADAMVERLIGAVRETTRIIGVTWVHSGTGVKLPLRAIADRLAAVNQRRPSARRVVLAVDGVHGLGVESTPVSQLGCDLFAAGCHKWLYGPRGTGIVWGRPAGWEALAPVIPSFGSEQYGAWMAGSPAALGTLGWGATMTPGGFHSFEQRWALADAFAFHQRLGRRRVQERIAALVGRLRSGLSEIPRLRIRTPADPEISAGIVCFEIEGADPDAAVALLRERGVRISVAPYATRHLRAGPTLWVDEAGIDRALDEIRRVARRA